MQDIRHVLITAEAVRGEKPPSYWTKGEAAEFWATWAEGEEKYHGKGMY